MSALVYHKSYLGSNGQAAVPLVKLFQVSAINAVDLPISREHEDTKSVTLIWYY
jgi:hypothetical protein